MGQYYKTSEPHFVDNKMFQLPHELMAKAIDTKDKAIDTDIDAALANLGKLKASVLEADKPELRKKIKDYENQINTVVDSIKSDPMKHYKYSSDIKNLSRKIDKDWSETGKIGTMEAYKKRVDEAIKEIKEKHAKDPKKFDADTAEHEIKAILANYKGVGWDEDADMATAIAGGTPDVQDLYHELDFDTKLVDKLKAEGIKREWDSSKGFYKYTTLRGTDGVTSDRIMNVIKALAHEDTTTQNALQRRRDLSMSDFQDIDPNNATMMVERKGKDGKMHKVEVINTNNFYGKRMLSDVSAHEYMKEEYKDTFDVDNAYVKILEEKEKALENSPSFKVRTKTDNVAKTIGDLKTFKESLVKDEQGIQNTIDLYLKESGIEAGSKLYNDIKNKNINAITQVFGHIDPEASKALIGRIKEQQQRAGLYNVVNDHYTEWTTKNPRTKDENSHTHYKRYLAQSGVGGFKSNNFVDNTATLQGMALSRKDGVLLQKTLTNNFADIVLGTEGKSIRVPIDADGNTANYKFVDVKDNRAGKVGVTVQYKQGGKTLTKKVLMTQQHYTNNLKNKNGIPLKVDGNTVNVQVVSGRTPTFYQGSPFGEDKFKIGMIADDIGNVIRTEDEGIKFATTRNHKEFGIEVPATGVSPSTGFNNDGERFYVVNTTIGGKGYQLTAAASTSVGSDVVEQRWEATKDVDRASHLLSRVPKDAINISKTEIGREVYIVTKGVVKKFSNATKQYHPIKNEHDSAIILSHILELKGSKL